METAKIILFTSKIFIIIIRSLRYKNKQLKKQIKILEKELYNKWKEIIMKEYIDEIGKLLVDRNLNDVDLENDDEQFGALLMIGHLRLKIYPILDKIRRGK